MSLLIPTGDGKLTFFDLHVTLEAVTYTIECRWNVRANAWFMSLFDEQGTAPLLTGVRLVADWLLFSNNVDSGGPPGAFMAYDTSGQSIDPAFEDFGSRVQLVYLTAAELGLAT